MGSIMDLFLDKPNIIISLKKVVWVKYIIPFGPYNMAFSSVSNGYVSRFDKIQIKQINFLVERLYVLKGKL